MNKGSMKKTVVLLFAAALLATPAAFAQSTGQATQPLHHPEAEHNGHARAEEMVNQRVDRLAILFNLTPQQKNETETYFKQAWENNRPLMMQIRQDRKTLENDVQAKADEAKIGADAAAIGREQGSILANNSVAREKFFSMLSPAEQSKYEKLQATRSMGFEHPWS